MDDYGDVAVVPRLLVICGHTFREGCLDDARAAADAERGQEARVPDLSGAVPGVGMAAEVAQEFRGDRLSLSLSSEVID